MSNPNKKPPTHSIVEYFHHPTPEGHRCGYCKSESTNYSNGMWAHTISPTNYELLINRGWRRSGSYVYKPTNDVTCCPMYTIRAMCKEIVISRGQRRVLKRFRRFIEEGVKVVVGEGVTTSSDCVIEEQEMSNSSSRLRVVSKQEAFAGGISPHHHHHRSAETAMTSAMIEVKPEASTTTTTITDSKKLHPLKKKPIRREKKRQKLLSKGLDPEEFFSRNSRKVLDELAGYFRFDENDEQDDDDDDGSSGKEGKSKRMRHKFCTKLVKVDSEEFYSMEFEMEHKLYEKYQVNVHGDTLADCKQSQFKRFLCDNPFDSDAELQEEKYQTRRRGPSKGTYHQQYYIDEKLIAVGVIDILDTCLSSVYFFYDPSYNHLSLGTLGALHEINFVNQLNTLEGYSGFKYYYLGFYIHSCTKMAYKRSFRPCQLVCPVTYEWVDFDERVGRLLDGVKFVKLSGRSEEGEDKDVVKKLLLLKNRKVYKYEDYVSMSLSSVVGDDDSRELEEFARLVGPLVAPNILLYRSS